MRLNVQLFLVLMCFHSHSDKVGSTSFYSLAWNRSYQSLWMRWKIIMASNIFGERLFQVRTWFRILQTHSTLAAEDGIISQLNYYVFMLSFSRGLVSCAGILSRPNCNFSSGLAVLILIRIFSEHALTHVELLSRSSRYPLWTLQTLHSNIGCTDKLVPGVMYVHPSVHWYSVWYEGAYFPLPKCQWGITECV